MPFVTLPYTELFTGPDGNAWPSDWSTVVGTSTLASNRGQLTPDSGPATYAVGRADFVNMPVLGDTDITGTVVMAAAGVEQYAVISIDSDLAGIQDGGANSYALIIDYFNGPRLTLRAMVNGSKTDLVYATKTLVGTTVYNFRFQRVGLVLRAKVWTGLEQPAWDISYTIAGAAYDSNGGAAFTGRASLAVSNGNDNTPRVVTYDSITISDVSAVSLPFAEAFTGADGAGWPAVWTTRVGGTSMQNNTGQLVVTDTSGYAAANARLTMAPLGNTEVTGSVMGTAADIEQYVEININGDSGSSYYGNSPANSYYLCINYDPSPSNSYVSIYQTGGDHGAGTEDEIAAGPRRTLTGTVQYGFRVQRIDRVIRGRVWDVSTVEPSGWEVRYVLPGAPMSGTVSLGVQRSGTGAGGTFMFDNVAVSIPHIAYYDGLPVEDIRYGAVSMRSIYLTGNRVL
jgi:hypothetical protein